MIYDSIVSQSTEKNPNRFSISRQVIRPRQAFAYFDTAALSIPIPRLAYGGMVIGK